MIVDIPTQDLTVAAPLAQEPLLIMRDLELAHVGGGMEGSCHF
jgi:hypothetical protein